MNQTSGAEDMIDGQTMERLRHAADAAASLGVIPRPQGKSYFYKRVHAANHALKKLEDSLGRQSVAHVPTDPQLIVHRSALLELGASYRTFRAAIRSVAERSKPITQLPRLIDDQRQDMPRVAGVARAYLDAVDGSFSAQTFRVFIRALQEHEPLNLDELWNIGTFLRFVLLETILDEAQSMLKSPGAISIPLLLTHIKCLRSITNADWVHLIEPLIAFDSALRQDPAGAFAQMDFETRELYRKSVADVARRSDCTESQVAEAALHLAVRGKAEPSSEQRIQRRREHIGYYLLGDGFPLLASRVGFHPSLAWQSRTFVRTHAEDFFLSGIQLFTIFFIAAALFPVLPVVRGFIGLAAIVIFLVLPASQVAVDLVNNAITSFFDPEPLPKLDFSAAVPRECATLVAVPTLLLNEQQVRKLVNDLEVRFLGNRDPNLHYALLSDLADSVSKPHDKDSHPLVDLAVRLIHELNAKYQGPSSGVFLLLHRHRVYNARQGVWMGWERKRGKLLDLNKLLAGEYDAFPIKAGPIGALEGVRYILTLDSDTQLPRGEAARLVGAIAHPLNQAIIDPKLRIVTAGYGILQPRIGVTVRSTAHSRLAAIYSGENGFDIYTRAISDAYQDLFGEGIFTGKGIYEVATLHAVLNRRFPRNSLLSHDLIEGAYARAGLATDIELVDDYPSHYNAYIRRKHRWVRGDWQIAQWMFSSVADESGHSATNPISSISRWKIFDNLRRSLVDSSFFALFLAGWIHLPGGPLYWTIVPIVLLFLPAVAQFAFSLGRVLLSEQKGQMSEAIAGFGHAALMTLLRFAFLSHETLLAFDAIIRSLVRRLITGERLLEWETAAQSELYSSGRAYVDRYLAITPLLSIAAGILVWLITARSHAIFYAAPVLALWALTNPVTAWLNHPPYDPIHLTPADRKFLSSHALRIWRYFREFGVERHNYLIPDNVMEEELCEAPRVSPTNIGLLLNARLAAYELGFLTVPEFTKLTRRTLATIDALEKCQGHLYNWYDSQTLRPLDDAPFVSSVDSGNLVASLFTLHAGTRDLANKPLLGTQLFAGLHSFLHLYRSRKLLHISTSRIPVPPPTAGTATWIAWLLKVQHSFADAAASSVAEQHDPWPIQEAAHHIDAILDLLHNYLPWALPEFVPLSSLRQLGLELDPAKLNCAGALNAAEKLQFALAGAHRAFAVTETSAELTDRLSTLLPAAIDNLRALETNLQAVARDSERLALDTDFSFLADPYRQALSIGYDMGAQRRHDSCYDLLASEARMATFLAVARGDLPQQGWYKLGRDHTWAYDRFLLLSWSGTMFEYLMPALWMRSFPGTLIARTQEAVVHVQQAFGRSHSIPWGISESASSHKNDRGHYHYFAYGIPQISLWFEATAGPVVSPYSTFLTLSVDPRGALQNLRRMESAGWVGAYGFYESADYSVSSRKPGLAREWMAHHHGMSLLAITNLLCNNIVQDWFHAHPLIQATEMLLQEIPVNRAVLKARLKEMAPIRQNPKAFWPPRLSQEVKAAL